MTSDFRLLRFVGGRLHPERSRAVESHKYRDPAESVRFESEKGDGMQEKLGTKAIETILKAEIENWMRWGRRRDWMPTSFKCVLGRLHIRTRIPLGDERYDPNYVPPEVPTEASAARFERVVINLPDRHRQAFVMYHLDRGIENGRIVKIESREHMARMLGVQIRMCEYLVSGAHNMVLREWRKIIAVSD